MSKQPKSDILPTLIPARIIHPCSIFFSEIATRIVEGCGIEDEEERYALEEAIIQFLKGGVMTEAAKTAIASYFGQNPQVWQNLWDNYLEHSTARKAKSLK